MSARKMKYRFSKSQISEQSYTKIKEKVYKRVSRIMDRSIDKIIKIMKKGKYQNLSDEDL